MTADQRLTLAEVSADRTCLSRAVQLPAGDRAQLRLLEPTDGDRFGHFLRELSEATRSLYAPHPLTLDFGRQLCCELDYAGLSDPSDLLRPTAFPESRACRTFCFASHGS